MSDLQDQQQYDQPQSSSWSQQQHQRPPHRRDRPDSPEPRLPDKIAIINDQYFDLQGNNDGDNDDDRPPNHVNLVFDPSQQQQARDINVNMGWDIEPSWEDADLKEFSRLARYGLVVQAKRHFALSTLQHVRLHPYIQVQYVEMLLDAGEYRAFRELEFFSSSPSVPQVEGATGTDVEERRRTGKLVVNYALLDLLSQRSFAPDDIVIARGTLTRTLEVLRDEPFMGSTELQLLAFGARHSGPFKALLNQAIYAGKSRPKFGFDWTKIYDSMLDMGYIWDFRDLFLVLASWHGLPDSLSLFYAMDDTSTALEIMVEDWSAPQLDEATALGLLDLFSSLILMDHHPESKDQNMLLARHAVAMVKIIRKRGNIELVTTRPYLKWLLARTACDLAPRLPSRDGLKEYGIALLPPGDGVRLPVFVPNRHLRKPAWDMFRTPSKPHQFRISELVELVASTTGDHSTLAEGFKLAISRSEDPKP
ncbi:uncharacterized protein C8A04DRAFT_32061 [Dichotomopilus funicola]|uniref:Uncharacterized protein n=1 Tax=Dichotomopilus funicola TaxID=1934379 RepID=A0AAN6ZK66_9PEZI|nr:hypothetical protein C8A04DRAFT_32061 [Dichotomopilus funicola]